MRFRAYEAVRGGAFLRGDDARYDRLAGFRHLVQKRKVQVAVDSERERARNGRCGHRQKMRPHAIRMRGKRGALVDPKSVLFVHHDKAKFLKTHAFLNERMRAHNDIR